MAMDWKVAILRDLQIRNNRENGGFTELIISHSKLLDQVESLRKEITRLDYHKNELEKQMEEMERDGSVSGGQGDGGSSREVGRLKKKVDELNAKLMSKTEELVDWQKKYMDSTENLRKKEDEQKKNENVIQDLEKNKKKYLVEISSLTAKLKEKEMTIQTLQDELQALQTATTATESKLVVLEKENDVLRSQLIQIKSQQADDLNQANETIRKKRDKKLEEEIRRASEEKESSMVVSALAHVGINRRSSKSDKARMRSGSGPEQPGEVVGPSICPSVPFHTFDAHDSEVSALSFSGDSNYMATGGADKIVKVWSWRPSQEKMELKFTLRGCTQSIMSIQFDQNCRQVLAASNDSSARIWTFHEERPKHALTGHANKVMAAKFMEDNSKVVTGSHDRTLKIWDLQHKTCVRTLFAGSSCNDAVAGRGLGTTVISGHFDRRIRFWDTRTATANEIALQGKVTSLDHFSDRHLLLCCSRDDALRLIDLRQNSIVATFNASGFRVSVDWTRACFSPDGQYVAAGSSDGSLFVWDTNMGSKPKREKCKDHSKEVVVCSWDPKGQLFATADRNKRVTMWKR